MGCNMNDELPFNNVIDPIIIWWAMTEAATASSEIDMVCYPFKTLTTWKKPKRYGRVAALQLFRSVVATNLGGYISSG